MFTQEELNQMSHALNDRIVDLEETKQRERKNLREKEIRDLDYAIRDTITAFWKVRGMTR